MGYAIDGEEDLTQSTPSTVMLGAAGSLIASVVSTILGLYIEDVAIRILFLLLAITLLILGGMLVKKGRKEDSNANSSSNDSDIDDELRGEDLREVLNVLKDARDYINGLNSGQTFAFKERHSQVLKRLDSVCEKHNIAEIDDLRYKFMRCQDCSDRELEELTQLVDSLIKRLQEMDSTEK